METRRLELLVALARLGSMREVAEQMGVTTSTVSQQLGALAHEIGAQVLEPVGRRVRLTPAGRRLADRAIPILAAIDAARADLDPATGPAGTVRVAGFATAIRRSLLPLVADLARRHPAVQLSIAEHEPDEALALLAEDAVDCALVYDYGIAPRTFAERFETMPLWTARWAMCVPAGETVGHPHPGSRATAAAVVDTYRDRDWIVNSRNDADERVVAALTALAGFSPRIAHRVDDLGLVQDLVAAGLGIALLPADEPLRGGVRLLPLDDPQVLLRAFAVVGRGRAAWAPLALIADSLSRASLPRADPGSGSARPPRGSTSG